MKGFLDYTNDIQIIKSVFSSPMGGILKYIQNNENLFINQNFFGGKNKISQNDIDELLKTFDEKLSEIKNIKKELKDSDLQDVEKKFILNSLNGAGLNYMIFKSAVFLEAEKSGFELTPDQRKFYLRRVNKLQDIVYGPEIISIESEKKFILKKIQKLINSRGDRLSEIEKEFIAGKLGLFTGEIPVSTITGRIEKKYGKDVFLSKEKVILLFETFLDLYNLDSLKISVEDVGNFSVLKIDDENELENGKYSYKLVLPESKLERTSLKRIFQLFDHEIGVHVIRGYNGTKTLNTKGNGYSELEEGLAKLSELLFDKNLDNIKIEPGLNHIVGFFAENFDGEDTRKFAEFFLKLIRKIGTSEEIIKKDALNLMLRVKRFVSLKEKGANRKDVSYTRGQEQIVEYFQNNDDETRGQFLKDFYFAKLSFEDIGLVDEFRTSLGIDEKELKYPLWIGKILYKKLLGEKITLAGLQEEDFRFHIIDKLSIDVKRKIVKILQKIKKD